MSNRDHITHVASCCLSFVLGCLWESLTANIFYLITWKHSNDDGTVLFSSVSSFHACKTLFQTCSRSLIQNWNFAVLQSLAIVGHVTDVARADVEGVITVVVVKQNHVSWLIFLITVNQKPLQYYRSTYKCSLSYN